MKILHSTSEDNKGRETTRGVFQRKVSDRLKELWKEKESVKKNEEQ